MGASIREIVEAQVSEKIAKGEALHASIESVRAAQKTLDTANKNLATARAEALKAGWTEAELRRANLAPANITQTRAPRQNNSPKAAADHSAQGALGGDVAGGVQ